MDTFTILSKQGLQLSARVNQPPSNAEQGRPLIILLHGNTGWKEEEHLVTLADNLAGTGFVTVQFDAPGSGESEGTWEKDYRVSNYLDAVDDVYDYMVENYPIDAANVGVWGHSMGGMVAVYSAARHSDRYAAVCGSELSGGTMSDTHATFGDTTDGDVKMETENFGTITLPKDYFDDRAQYSTLATVQKLNVPQLFIAGTQDDMVPASSVREIFEKANEPKEYHEFPADHMYKHDPENLKAINELTVSFFKKHLQV